MEAAGQSNNSLKDYFEKIYGKKLTDVEVVDYKNRIVNLFSLLAEIDQRNKKLKKN